MTRCFMIPIVFGMVAVAACQTQSLPKKQEPTSRYSSVEFSLSQTKLPSNYYGHDFRRIYALLSKRTEYSKGEFESQADYDRRKAAQMALPLVTRMTMGSLYAFQALELGSYYDAEKEMFEIFPSAGEFCYMASCKLTLARQTLYHRMEPRTNAYGAIVDVEYEKQEVYQLDLQTHPEMIDARIRFPVARSRAPAVKKQLRALAICKLRSTSDSDSYSDPPTFDNPYFGTTHRKRLVVDLIDVWFYDLATGEVFAKLSGAPISSGVMAKVRMGRTRVQITVDGQPFLDSDKIVVARKEVVVKADDGAHLELFCGEEHLKALSDVHNEATATCTSAGVHVEVGKPTPDRRFTVWLKDWGLTVVDITVDGKPFYSGVINYWTGPKHISAEKEVVITGCGAEVSFDGHDGPHRVRLPDLGKQKGTVTVTAAEVDY